MRLGRVEVSSGFLLLFAWLFYRDPSGIVWQAMLACFLHEASHCLALWYFRKPIKQITITPFGAQLSFDDVLSYGQELICAAAGPASNLLLAYLACTFPAGRAFAGVNLALALFNLLPVGSLDGARMLRCGIAILLSDQTAYSISKRLSFSFTVLFFLLGLYCALYFGNMTLFLMCLWLMNRQSTEKTF